jgi:hypothetical protein
VSTTTIADTARREMTGFGGELIGPSDPSYQAARAVYNAMIDRSPALIARCASTADVARTVGFARDRGELLAVRGGGHNGGGLGTCDDGIVLDLGLMKDVVIDEARRTVRVGGGATWADVDSRTGPLGLATPSGIIATTGVGGLTLGGGIGYISRRYGLTIDSLLSAEVVLPDGSTVRASADENPDLHWALRGGGGNFGVVTEFEFQLHPVPSVFAGPTFWPLEQMPDVMRWYREFLPAQPREVNGWFATLTVPPVPLFPEALHMQKVCAVMWTVLGTQEEVDRHLAPALATGTASARCRGPTSRACSRRSTRPGSSGTGGPTSCARSRTTRSPNTAGSPSSCRRPRRRCTCTRSTVPSTTCRRTPARSGSVTRPGPR